MTTNEKYILIAGCALLVYYIYTKEKSNPATPPNKQSGSTIFTKIENTVSGFLGGSSNTNTNSGGIYEPTNYEATTTTILPGAGDNMPQPQDNTITTDNGSGGNDFTDLLA